MEICAQNPNGLSASPSPLDAELDFFSCSYPNCGYKNKRMGNVARHETCHSCSCKWEFPCKVCFGVFGALVRFLHHMSTRHGDKLVCSFCEFQTQDLTQFKAHMLTHSCTSKWSHGSSKSSPCEQMEESPLNRIAKILDSYNSEASRLSTLTSERNLCVHEENMRNKYERKHEKQSWKSFPGIQGAQPENHATGPNDGAEKVGRVQRKLFTCQKCSFRTAYVQNMRRHYRIHTDERPYKCMNLGCDYRSRWVHDLVKHQNFGCRGRNVESKTSQTKGNLGLEIECGDKIQINDESSNLAYACMLCDFIGDSELSALKHSRQHKTRVILLDPNLKGGVVTRERSMS